jgi:hypothetical protein
MKRLVFPAVLAVVIVTAACGGTAPDSAPASTPAPAPPPAAAAPPAATLSLLEPVEGAMSGHIDTFRWSAAAGADGYVIRIQGSDGRVIWESAPMAETETKLPTTVALEPEVHTWMVTAMKGTDVLVASAPQRFTITP